MLCAPMIYRCDRSLSTGLGVGSFTANLESNAAYDLVWGAIEGWLASGELLSHWMASSGFYNDGAHDRVEVAVR